MRTIHAFVVVAMMVAATSTQAANPWGLKSGNPELKSAGPLAFGPDGVLLVGDTKSAAVVAIQTDKSDSRADHDLDISDLKGKVAAALGASEVTINDLAVNPEDGTVYLSASKDASGAPAILQITGKGEMREIPLADVPFAKAMLSNPPEDKEVKRGRRSRNPRNDSITDVTYVEGRVFVSGLSSAKSPSSVRTFDFPFSDSNSETSLEIYHGAHGKFEDTSAIRTFTPLNIDGEPHLLAGFICTPLVKIPIKGLGKDQIRGTTIAELGNRNVPLDMVVYKKDGKEFVLLSNSARGVMKISTDDISRDEGITERISGTAGQSYATIEDLKDVAQLDKLDDQHAVVLVQSEGHSQLKAVPLP